MSGHDNNSNIPYYPKVKSFRQQLQELEAAMDPQEKEAYDRKSAVFEKQVEELKAQWRLRLPEHEKKQLPTEERIARFMFEQKAILDLASGIDSTSSPPIIERIDSDLAEAEHIAVDISEESEDNSDSYTYNDDETGPGSFFHDHEKFKAIHLSIDHEGSPLLGKKPTKDDSFTKLSCMRRGWNWYEKQLQKNPILTKSLTSALLTAAGDLAGQCLEHSGTGGGLNLNLHRTSCFFLLGLLLQGPITHYYYILLDAKLPPTPTPWTWTTLLKLLIDQLLFAPSFTVAVFLFLDILEGESATAAQHLQHDFVTTLVANWKLWVPASLINMAFCPPKLRVLYCNVIFFVWSICLSLLLNHDDSDNTSSMEEHVDGVGTAVVGSLQQVSASALP